MNIKCPICKSNLLYRKNSNYYYCEGNILGHLYLLSDNQFEFIYLHDKVLIDSIPNSRTRIYSYNLKIPYIPLHSLNFQNPIQMCNKLARLSFLL